MKVRYINEGGLFKTPDQVRREMERRSVMSDEEIVAKNTKEMMKAAIENLLTKKNSGEVRDFVGFTDWLSKILISICKSLMKIKGSYDVTMPDIKFKMREEGNDIIFDLYPDLLNDSEYCKRQMTPVSEFQDDAGYICELNSYLLCDEAYSYKIYDKALDKDAKIGAEQLKNGIMYARKMTNDSREKDLYNYILSKNIVINKIHIFGGLSSDVHFCYEKNLFYASPQRNLRNRFTLMSELFSFDNSGETTFRIVNKVETYSTNVDVVCDLSKICDKLGEEKTEKLFELLRLTVEKSISAYKIDAEVKRNSDELGGKTMAQVKQILVAKYFEELGTDNLKMEIGGNNCLLNAKIDKATGNIIFLLRNPYISSIYVKSNTYKVGFSRFFTSRWDGNVWGLFTNKSKQANCTLGYSDNPRNCETYFAINDLADSISNVIARK